MKLVGSFIAIILFSLTQAQAASPPPPFIPTEAFQYLCEVQVTKVQADSSTRYSGTMKATTLVEKSEAKGAFNSAIDITHLDWKSVTGSGSEQPLNFKIEGLSASLEFLQQSGAITTVLSVFASQQSESKMYQLSSYGKTNEYFQVGQKVEAEANVEERANWIKNEIPKGLLMSSTSFKVKCLRLN